jgi:hypothetical protein
MDKGKLETFLFNARAKTYAGSAGKVMALLPGTTQLEFTEDEWLYRDVYYNGKDGFIGMEAIFYQNEAVWSMSYYGHYYGITEEEIDKYLKPSLLANVETRGRKKIYEQYDGHRYICEPDFDRGIDEIAGLETIERAGKMIYHLFYAGSLLK